MQSLIKKKSSPAPSCCAPATTATVAQCCAKVSKNVAGCHD